MHYLYRITNQLNQKIYIGQTVNDKTRWIAHKSFAKNPEKTGQYIHRAMAKHGVENFVFEVIATCRTQEDANETEAQLIVQHNSRHKEFGYNIEPGGNSGPMSEETRAKLQAVWDNMTEEQKQARVQNMIAANVGREVPKHVREAISKALIGRVQSPEEIAKRTESMLEFWATHPEEIERCAGRGKKLCTPEHLEKFTRKGAVVTEETKQKIKVASAETQFKPGIVPWNTGTIGVMKPNSGSFKPGQSISPATQFKPGANYNAWNRKLTQDQEIEILEKYQGGQSKRSLAREYNIDRTSINHIVKRNVS